MAGLPNEANAREFSIKQQQRQCRVPSDCTSLCHGCTVTQCTAGRCVCNCASTIRSTNWIISIWPHFNLGIGSGLPANYLFLVNLGFRLWTELSSNKKVALLSIDFLFLIPYFYNFFLITGTKSYRKDRDQLHSTRDTY
jgi:hypothetical protein